ncbi:MAG: sugar nucleotide-binding protein [bacterium]|nr:sugar nucleotide-binding protein [bacterium]
MPHALILKATQHIVNYANDNGTPVIFFSTDLVFDGKKGAYTESDAPNPVNYYGETKLLAEQSVLNALESNIVCRIALSYGKNAPEAKGGYLDKLLEGIQAGKKQFLFTDQYRTPLYSGDLCQATAILLEHMVHGNSGKVSRIFHLGGPDTLSRYQIGEQTAQIFGFSLQLLCPVTMADIQNKVQRGSDCSLSIDRAKHELGFVPRNMKECLHRDKQMREEKQKNGNFNRN